MLSGAATSAPSRSACSRPCSSTASSPTSSWAARSGRSTAPAWPTTPRSAASPTWSRVDGPRGPEPAAQRLAAQRRLAGPQGRGRPRPGRACGPWPRSSCGRPGSSSWPCRSSAWRPTSSGARGVVLRGADRRRDPGVVRPAGDLPGGRGRRGPLPRRRHRRRRAGEPGGRAGRHPDLRPAGGRLHLAPARAAAPARRGGPGLLDRPPLPLQARAGRHARGHRGPRPAGGRPPKMRFNDFTQGGRSSTSPTPPPPATSTTGPPGCPSRPWTRRWRRSSPATSPPTGVAIDPGPAEAAGAAAAARLRRPTPPSIPRPAAGGGRPWPSAPRRRGQRPPAGRRDAPGPARPDGPHPAPPRRRHGRADGPLARAAAGPPHAGRAPPAAPAAPARASVPTGGPAASATRGLVHLRARRGPSTGGPAANGTGVSAGRGAPRTARVALAVHRADRRPTAPARPHGGEPAPASPARAAAPHERHRSRRRPRPHRQRERARWNGNGNGRPVPAPVPPGCSPGETTQ